MEAPFGATKAGLLSTAGACPAPRCGTDDLVEAVEGLLRGESLPAGCRVARRGRRPAAGADWIVEEAGRGTPACRLDHSGR